jgi:hypothetical protein
VFFNKKIISDMKKILLASLLMGSVSAYAQTVKKVILEDFTGIWCQHCPNGTKGIEDLEVTYPTNFLPVASHNLGGRPASYDLLAIADGATVADGLGISSYPCGAIDRKKIAPNTAIGIPINTTASQWKSAMTTRVAVSAIVSVGISNKVKMPDGSYEADITVKFSSAPAANTPINVQVYLLEDKIPATNSNGLAQASSGVQYGGADPLLSTHGYYHNHTLRAALGGAWGWNNVVTVNPKVDSVYKKHIKFTIPDASTTPATVPAGGWVKNNVKLYAFVAYDGSAASDKKEILNAEEVSLKTFFPTGVNEIEANTSILSVYPNPASVNDVIKMEYNIMESSEVTMKVYNISGQLVAQPFKSQEVAGSHTLQWRASEHNLPAGTYIMQLSTPNGMQSQKITLQ